jgi:Predicted ester cyclase
MTPPPLLPSLSRGGTYRDPVIASGLTGSAIADYASGLFTSFPDLTFEVVSAAPAEHGTVAAQWLMRGTNTGSFAGNPPTGRTVALPGADFITVEEERIRSVQGYFDQKTFGEQLGLQVIVQPYFLGAFAFGSSVRMESGKRTKPGAVSLTWIQVRSDQEAQEVVERVRRITEEMAKMPGFISYASLVVGHRLCTVTAWEDPESPRQLLRGGAHQQAMERALGPDFSAALHTGVWVPHHLNPLWVRCTVCGRMADVERLAGKCQCGQLLPEPPPYW